VVAARTFRLADGPGFAGFTPGANEGRNAGWASRGETGKMKEYSMRKLILVGLMAAVALPGAPAQSRGEIRRDHEEVREQREDLRDARQRGDRSDIREEREDLREARQELREDRRDRRQDRRRSQYVAPYRAGATAPFVPATSFGRPSTARATTS
jgi:hypothetical protein